MTAALLDRSTARRPANRAERGQARPRLRVIDQAAARRRSRHRMALLILFIIVLAGFFAVAFVHAELVAGQNELDAVRSEIREAEANHADLARAVEEASAPATIVARAHELGMVRPAELVYLTATAPVRDVEVRPAPATPIASESPETGPAATAGVAAPSERSAQGATSDADRALRGSLGSSGGISAAVQLPDPSTQAVGATVDAGSTGSLAGASTGPVDAAAPEVSATPAGVTAVSPETAATPAPVSTIAGTRAVTGTAGAVASTSTSGLAMAAAATGAG